MLSNFYSNFYFVLSEHFSLKLIKHKKIFLLILHLMLINDKQASLRDIENFLSRGYLGRCMGLLGTLPRSYPVLKILALQLGMTETTF